MSRWPLFCCRQKLDKMASHPSSTKVYPFLISAPPLPPGAGGRGGGEEGCSYSLGVLRDCPSGHLLRARSGLPKRWDSQERTHRKSDFCDGKLLYIEHVGSILGQNFMLPLSLAESLGCLQIGVKKPCEAWPAAGKPLLSRAREPPWVECEHCRPYVNGWAVLRWSEWRWFSFAITNRRVRPGLPLWHPELFLAKGRVSVKVLQRYRTNRTWMHTTERFILRNWFERLWGLASSKCVGTRGWEAANSGRRWCYRPEANFSISRKPPILLSRPWTGWMRYTIQTVVCVTLNFLSWNPNLQYIRMWLYSKTRPLKRGI